MGSRHQERANPQLRAASYARLSEICDEAESVPTRPADADRRAQWRGWRVAARFKDGGYPAFEEIRRGRHGACPSRPSVPLSGYAPYVQTRARGGTGPTLGTITHGGRSSGSALMGGMTGGASGGAARVF
jgi:hypothetical protein